MDKQREEFEAWLDRVTKHQDSKMPTPWQTWQAAQAAQPVQVPIYQYQLANGNWIDQTKESHDYNVRHGQATTRTLYAAPSTKEQSNG